MKLFSQLLVLGLAAEVTVASNWFSKAVYNKWHENELERWLSDNDIPYPSPADRKDLEAIIKENWQSKVASPYSDWDTTQLQSYLQQKGIETKEAAAANKDSLLSQVKAYWYETEDKAEDAWTNIKSWIFDSWTDSQLKLFADKHNIPVPQPRTRDVFLQHLRSNYESIAKKAGETAHYPGNWLYETWTESDLKEYLDTHGIPAPQPTTRDKLIASVRKNSRLASLKYADSQASASASAAAAQETLSEKLLAAWSDSQIKEWADKNGIKVPQGSKRNELIAIARKHKAQLIGDTAVSSISASISSASLVASKSAASAASVASKSASSVSSLAAKSASSAASVASKSGTSITSVVGQSASSGASVASDSATSVASQLSASASSAFGAATTAAGNEFAKATDDAQLKGHDAFNAAIGAWSDSRLKAYLDARGIPVPQSGKKDELVAAVRLQAHKAASGWTAWTYDTWTYDNLKSFLLSSGNAAAEKAANQAGSTRDDLVSAAQSYYAEASKSSGPAYASVTSYLAKATDAAKDSAFETWSDSDLKAYLDTYGVPVPQGSTSNQLKAYARNQANWFRYGTTTPQGTLWVKLNQGAQWIMNQLSIGAAAGKKQAAYQGEKATDRVKEAGTYATNRAAEAAQKAKHRVQEEL
jgi:roadblock/LC7 domain-containing protein